MRAHRCLILLLALIVLCVGVAACGSSSPRKSPAGAIVHLSTHPRSRASLTLSERCPPNHAFMGCSSGASPYTFATAPVGAKVGEPAKASSGAKFPDVSDWQGCSINWSRVGARAAIIKLWEYSEDSCAAHNIDSLKAAHKLWTVYDFVRYCSASGFLNALARFGRPPLPVVLDEEVPAANNCTATMSAQIKRALGQAPIEYTSPGTETAGAGNGSPPLWEADYGPSYRCLWTCRPVAWQFASPPYVYYYISGLGYGDVSVDLGLLEMGGKPPAKHLVCFGSKAQHNATCKGVIAKRASDLRAVSASRNALASVRVVLEAHHCVVPYRRGVCVRNGIRAALFTHRIAYFAAHAALLLKEYS
jgi:hypothetical protein